MGSAEGFGGGVLVTEVGGLSGDACSSGVQKDNQVDDMSVPASWGKMPVSEICRQASQSPSLPNKNIAKNSGSENKNFPSLALDIGDKLLIGRTDEIPRSTSACSRRSGMVSIEVSDSKSGLLDAEGMSLELALYPARSNPSEKTQMVKQRKSSLIKPGDNRNEKTQVAKQRKSSLSKRGDKRNGKMHKRCDSISLKNGLVSFNSAAAGNNFFGIYGLKADVFDITKYLNEIPLDEILHGKYQCPSIANGKEKKAVNSNCSLLQSVRKAYSVLQARKVLQAEKCAEIDHSCNQKVSTNLVTASSSTSQSDSDKGESCDADRPSFEKVRESVSKINISTMISDSPLYQPKEILERLALSPPKDLESLLFDVAKPASSCLKQGNDPRLGKSVSLRAGLPPFPWSNSFSGHTKSGADASKLSASRTICQGRWVKVINSTALQRGSSDLQMDLESLTFDQSLVPSVNHKSRRPEHQIVPTEKHQIVPTEKLLPSSEACSISKIPAADEHSPVYAAAQALCELATHSSKKSPHSTIKLLGNPSQIAMKACKSKAMERSDKFSDRPKSINGTTNLIKLGDEGFPSKKLKLTTDVRNTYNSRTDSLKKQALNWSTPETVRSPPMKQFRESKSAIDHYNINLVKKSYMMKPPRAAERLGIGQQKLRKVDPMKWSRPEG